ncbi:hypothetical protein OY671_010399, partial [Metschnikowia pulcherrima]
QADYVIGREMVVICSPARLAARRAAGSWDSPAGSLGEPSSYHANGMDNWGSWFEAAGVRRDKLASASGFDQVSISVRAVMAASGIAVSPRCPVQDDSQAGRVAAPFPDSRIAIARGYHSCAPPQRRDHYASACFRQWLLDTAERDPDARAPSPA